MEYTRQRECEDDGQVEIKRWKDSEGTAHIKPLEADRTRRVQFLEQQAGDEKATDDEKHRNTGMRKQQIEARRDPLSEVLAAMGNDHEQDRDGAHAIKGRNIARFVVDLQGDARNLLSVQIS